MSLCVQLQPSGALVADTTPPAQCSGHILIDAADWQGMTGSNIWQIPATVEAAQLFGFGLVLVLLPPLIAWAVNSLLHPLEHH